ncbi:MAG TPA: serine/threonine-protein kinase, partial [Longimicrobiales bacterium]|nr:serine/threonine-protein kinase [Longimicrobiales bacterium]
PVRPAPHTETSVSTPDDPERRARAQPTVAWSPEADQARSGTVWSTEELSKLEADRAAAEAARKTRDPLIGTTMRGKWRVLERLGAGSFGTVYKVKDVKGGWVEALKVLAVDRLTGAEAEEMRKRFLREAQIMKRLGNESQHIVGLSTYEEDIEAGLVYFLMELVEGRSFARVLEEEGHLAPERAVHLALQVCDALMAAHEGPEPVVHRDLKLENLMLTHDRNGAEVVKILDFGIAKIAEREADSRLTTVGTLGTPGYAAPEQLRAQEVDARTDLFAVGVILYALLTGLDPWLGRPAWEPTDRVYELMTATDRAQAISFEEAGVSVPPALAAIVRRLLQRDPADRFQSARELRAALLRASAPAGAEAGAQAAAADAVTRPAPPARARPAPRPRPRPRRTGRLLASATLAVALLGGAAYLQPWGRDIDRADLAASAAAGEVVRAWLDDGGVGGYLAVGPLISAFFVSASEGELPALVAELRAAGVYVDTSWETRRLTQLAQRAQAGSRYYGMAGGDVLTFARRLAALEPSSREAHSLLAKVAERIAWDADAALQDGLRVTAEELVAECLEIVPDHPRCRAVPLER